MQRYVAEALIPNLKEHITNANQHFEKIHEHSDDSKEKQGRGGQHIVRKVSLLPVHRVVVVENQLDKCYVEENQVGM